MKSPYHRHPSQSVKRLHPPELPPSPPLSLSLFLFLLSDRITLSLSLSFFLFLFLSFSFSFLSPSLALSLCLVGGLQLGRGARPLRSGVKNVALVIGYISMYMAICGREGGGGGRSLRRRRGEGEMRGRCPPARPRRAREARARGAPPAGAGRAFCAAPGEAREAPASSRELLLLAAPGPPRRRRGGPSCLLSTAFFWEAVDTRLLAFSARGGHQAPALFPGPSCALPGPPALSPARAPSAS